MVHMLQMGHPTSYCIVSYKKFQDRANNFQTYFEIIFSKRFILNFRI